MKTIKDFINGEVYVNTDTIRVSKLDFITMVYIAIYEHRINRDATFNDVIKAYNTTKYAILNDYRCIVQNKYVCDNIVYVDAALSVNELIDIIKSYTIRADYSVKFDAIDIAKIRYLLAYINKSKDLANNEIKLIARSVNDNLIINCCNIM